MMRFPLAVLALTLAGTAAVAQEANGNAMAGMNHSNMDMSSPMGQMMGAMDTMMKTMPQDTTGMVDADFLLMMIPHHQSAIDMARVELEQGQDKETKAMAQAIIDAQEVEIVQMRSMLERMSVEAPAAE